MTIEEMREMVENKKQEIERMKGRLESETKTLKELTGTADIGESEDYLNALTVKLSDMRKELTESKNKFEEKYAELLR